MASIRTILSIFFLCAFLFVPAENSNQPNSKESGKSENLPTPVYKTVKYVGQQPGRPRMPSNECIYFYYDSTVGRCLFVFPEEKMFLTVDLKDNGGTQIVNGIVTTDMPYLEDSVEPGSYNLECTAADGTFYSGEVIVY